MLEEMDENGKLDMKTASAGAVVGAGLKMQKESKAAMLRINENLEQTEQVAEWTKEELQKQNK